MKSLSLKEENIIKDIRYLFRQKNNNKKTKKQKKNKLKQLKI